MNVSLRKALKIKTRLIGRLNELQSTIEQHNTVIEGRAVSPYNIAELREELHRKSDELIRLKTAITQANNPICEKIYRLSELKSLHSFYKRLDCTEGVSSFGYGENAKDYTKVASIKVGDVDRICEEVQNEIDTLQEELDEFNAVTRIEIPE